VTGKECFLKNLLAKGVSLSAYREGFSYYSRKEKQVGGENNRKKGGFKTTERKEFRSLLGRLQKWNLKAPKGQSGGRGIVGNGEEGPSKVSFRSGSQKGKRRGGS